MSKFSKAVQKMNKAEKKLKGADRFSSDPKRAEVEKKLYDAVAKVKKEGIQENGSTPN